MPIVENYVLFFLFLQTVYLREAAPPSNEKMSYQWDIPIVILPQDALKTKDEEPYEWREYCSFWMTKGGSSVVVKKDVYDQEKFIIVNPEEIGLITIREEISQDLGSPE